MFMYKKVVWVQMIMFGLFFLMGLNNLLKIIFPILNSNNIALYITLGLFLIIAISGILLYYSKNKETVSVTKKDVDHSKYVLYGYFIVYILALFSDNLTIIKSFNLGYIFSPILMIIAFIGVLKQWMILKKNN